jgi:hypothetical protein
MMTLRKTLFSAFAQLAAAGVLLVSVASSVASAQSDPAPWEAFDYPDSNLTCPERLVSINAPQALMLLNSDFALDESKALAERLLRDEPNASDSERFKSLWKLCFGRTPTEPELSRLQELAATLRSQRESSGQSPSEIWSDICHVVLNLNEFVFVD